jgi:catechol 2,3-dioxygenase-like lactoylglutathione lyase family enzyme
MVEVGSCDHGPTAYHLRMVRVTGLDHIVLSVDDVEKTLAWYCDELGLVPMEVEEWRAGKALFPSARIDATTIIDFIPRQEAVAVKNLDHLCLVIEPTDDLAGFDVAAGPVSRSGAQGIATSFYVYDPDGNLVELRYY